MLLGIDHLIVAVAHLDGAATQVRDHLGMAVGERGRHPALGTVNRLAWWGDTYLELVTIEDARAAAADWFGTAVAAALADADAAPVGLALASDDVAADATLAGLAEPLEGRRARQDGQVVRWRMTRPRRATPTDPWPLLFLIEHDGTAAEWTPHDRRARAAAVHPLGGPVRLRSVAAAVPSVPAAVGRLGREFRLAFRPSLAGGGARDASVGDQILRLTAARGAEARGGEPRMTIELRGGHEPRQLDLLGCRWRYVPA